MNCPKYMVVDNVPAPSASGKSYRVLQIAPNPKTQNVQPNPVKISYAANKNKFYQVPPQNVYSHSPAPLPTRIAPNPFLPAPPCTSSQNSGSTSREPLRETSVDNCVPSSVRFPKRYKMQSSELSKIHFRNPWLKDSIPAPRPASPPLENASDSEEDYEEEEDSPRSSPLFHHRHRYNFSGSETSFKDYDPLSCSDYDEDEEDSPRSSPLFHHRHRYNSDSETPYYSPYSEDSDDCLISSALAHQDKHSESLILQDDFSALTSTESIPAPHCTSSLVQDLVPNSGEEASPTSSPPKFPLCNNPTGPLTPVKNEYHPRFKGVKRVSLKGRHDVLVYSIPDTDNAYVFCHERTNVDYQVFKCLKCWNEKVKITIKVIGEKFFGNPCDLGHVCSPVDELEDRVERLTYKWLTDLQEQSKSCSNVPKEEYANFLIWLKDESDEDEWTRKALLNTFKQSGGYKEHQELFARFCKPKKARTRIEDQIEKFVQQTLSMHSSYHKSEEETKNSDMDERFSGKSTMEVLEWVVGMGDYEKFYTF